VMTMRECDDYLSDLVVDQAKKVLLATRCAVHFALRILKHFFVIFIFYASEFH